jgi:hypothetical protein
MVNTFIILLYIVLAIAIFVFLKTSKLSWNGRPLVRFPTRILISLIVPLILIAAFMFVMMVFVILAIILIAVFIMGLLQGRK